MRIYRPLLALALLGCAAAQAQVNYGGYNLGPDFGAMIRDQLAQGEQLAAQMQAGEQQIVQQAMQDPNCQALYQQHLAGGGQLPFHQFAWQYAATGGFTPDGIARFQRGERGNQEREGQSLAGYRNAQYQRGLAQNGYAQGYFHNQAEAGNVLQGNSSWVDPQSGQTRALAYMGGNAYVDANTGQQFVRDDSGQYYTRDSYGNWYAMNPAQ
jgi:hypothetical protein